MPSSLSGGSLRGAPVSSRHSTPGSAALTKAKLREFANGAPCVAGSLSAHVLCASRGSVPCTAPSQEHEGLSGVLGQAAPCAAPLVCDNSWSARADHMP